MLGSSLLDKGDVTDAEVMLRESLNITKIASPEDKGAIAVGKYLLLLSIVGGYIITFRLV